PIGHDRHLHGEHERKRTREESHGERRATKKSQNAEKAGPGQRRREAERRQDILRHRPGEAAEELHIAVVDDDRARAETDDGVAVGRNALVEPAEGGKYQPLRVDGALRARVHWFPPAWLSIRALILLAARAAIIRLRPLHRLNIHLRRQRAMDRTL